jgi:cytochrome c5
VLVLALLGGGAGLAPAQPTSAPAAPAAVRDGAALGEPVYRTVCASCHDAGQAGAPRLGDRRAWAPLIREGQPALTGVAYAGIRGMPAKGGAANLSLADFARATVYMANAGGARWHEPDTALLQRIEAVAARQRARQARATTPR